MSDFPPQPQDRDESDVGRAIHGLITELFPICRSITGDGVRQTLRRLKEIIPLEMHEVPTNTKVFDWTVPKEWNIRDAFILDADGRKVVDFKKNNLHVLGYSVPIDQRMSLADLQNHLYSLEDQPDAIPYLTSYYQERWGFCLTHNQRTQLKPGEYRVVIDSDLKPGHLTYGECLIPGRLDKELFLSTYVCHPSLANNELSGPGVLTFLIKWILSQPRKYSYRVVFIPETIGSITYLSRNLETMKRNIIAGFNLSCVGDDRAYSFLPSRAGDTLADRAARNVLRHRHPDFVSYSFLQRGSDERQYCSPGVDLPVASVMRTKYGQYPEYHTSLDDLNLVTPAGLEGSYKAYQDCIELLERNETYRSNVLCEPQLGRRGLYPTLSTKASGASVQNMMDFLAYADGTNDLLKISDTIQVPPWELYPIIEKLMSAGLLSC